MKHIKLFEQFLLNESVKFDDDKLKKFFDRFPNDAKTWSQATDELSEMYHWMTEIYSEWNEDEPEETHLKPVGRKNCKTPSEWNTKYKAAILAGLEKFKPYQKDVFANEFKECFR